MRYYCRPIKLYVSLLFRNYKGLEEVLFIATTTGEVLFPITIPFSTGVSNCYFINNKKYPWLYNWLIEKGIAVPTYRCLNKDNFSYEEFKFKKEK